jgi:hypothetical protein
MFEAACGIRIADDFKGSADRCKRFVSSADIAPRAEWISVEERLPDNCRAVLVALGGLTIGGAPAMMIGSYSGGFWMLADADGTHCLTKYMQCKVTHWMPLPEQPKDSENYEKKRLLAGDCFHGEIWCRCPYCFTGIEVHSIPKDRICHNCGKEYL